MKIVIEDIPSNVEIKISCNEETSQDTNTVLEIDTRNLGRVIHKAIHDTYEES